MPTMTYCGPVTDAMDYDVIAGAVQAALEALSTA
jgi:hypothetical protein